MKKENGLLFKENAKFIGFSPCKCCSLNLHPMRSLPSSSEETQGEQTKAKARAPRAQIDDEILTATRVYERMLHTTTQRNPTYSTNQVGNLKFIEPSLIWPRVFCAILPTDHNESNDETTSRKERFDFLVTVRTVSSNFLVLY